MNEDDGGVSADLERQRLLLQSILESMSDGVVVADEKGKFLAFNPAAERILGIGAHESPPSAWTREYGVCDAQTLLPVIIGKHLTLPPNIPHFRCPSGLKKS